MAQFASTGGSGQVLTVADLLSRNTPVPVKILGTQTAPPLSVDSLLRREGLTPPAAEEPVPFRGPEPRAAAAAPRTRGVMVRRTAIAAGTLLAAGSVFGAVQVTDASLGSQDTTNPYAGPSWLDGTSGGATTPGVVIAPTAADTTMPAGMDAGTPAPTSWGPVAFPGGTTGAAGATGGSGAAGAGDAGGGGTVKPPTNNANTGTADNPGGGNNNGGGTGGGTNGGGAPAAGGNTGGGGNGGGGTGGGTGNPGTGNPGTGNPGSGGSGSSGLPSVGGIVGAGSEAVGGVVSGVGSSTPLKGTTDALGGAVAGGGSAVGATADEVTAPVGSAVQGVTGGSGLLGGVGDTAASLLGS